MTPTARRDIAIYIEYFKIERALELVVQHYHVSIIVRRLLLFRYPRGYASSKMRDGFSPREKFQSLLFPGRHPVNFRACNLVVRIRGM